MALPGPPGEKGEPGSPGFGLPGKQVSFRASGEWMQTGLKRVEGPRLGLLGPWAVESRWECVEGLVPLSSERAGLIGLSVLCPGTR